MREIILDVRSNRKNDSSTGLCLREVLDRRAYEAGLRGDLMFLSEGNGDILSRGILGAYSEGDVSLEVLSGGLYGGTKVLVGGEYEKRGVVLSWTRNDEGRERFSSDFKLLAGGERLELGVVGGELSRLGSISEGVEIRVGGDGLDGSVWRGVIGGGSVVFTAGELGEYVFLEGEVIVYGADGSLRVREGEFEEGLSVYYMGVELEGGTGLLNVVGGEVCISPVPYMYEHIYLRVGTEGHIGESELRYFLTDESLRGGVLGEYEVGLSLSSGLLVLGSAYEGLEIRYEGLLLGRGGELISEQVVENGGVVLEGGISSTGVSSEGELRGLGYGSVFLNVGGVALLPVVEGSVAKRSDRAYFGGGRIRVSRGVELRGSVKGDGVLRLAQAFYACFLRRAGVTQKKVLGTAGSVSLASGGVVSFSEDGVVTGAGVMLPSGHLMLDEGEDFGGYYSEYGAVPQGLGTGVVLALRGSSVVGFRELEDEIVEGSLRSGSTYNFLKFVPRGDFSGYEGSDYFSAGGVLKRGVDLEYDFRDRSAPKVGWIEGRSVSGVLREPTSFFGLEAGVLAGSTSIKLSNGKSVEVLVEGSDYDLPFNAQGGFARQIKELGGELFKGFNAVDEGGGIVTLVSESVAPQEGYFLVFVNDGLYRQITGVEGLGDGAYRLTLSSDQTYDARGMEVTGDLSGGWYLYEGQLGDIEPDPVGVDLMRVNDECFVGLELSDTPFMRVFKTYSASTELEIAEVLYKKVSKLSALSARLADGSDVVFTELRGEILSERVVDLSSEHYVSGDFSVLVDGVEMISESYAIDGATGLITFLVEVDDLSEVVFQPQPRGLGDRVEFLEQSEGVYLLGSAQGVVKILEELVSSEYSAQPVTGGISFSQPLVEGVGVEVVYTPEGESAPTRETILFLKTLEECQRVDAKRYTFTSGIYLGVSPQVYINTAEEARVNIGDGTLTFSTPVLESERVFISYVREGSLGGEYLVKLSSKINKPLVKIEAGASEVVFSERLSLPELSVGEVLDFGDHSFLVTSITGNAVGISPPARFGLNVSEVLRSSRADLFLSISNVSLSSKKKSSDIFLKGDFRSLIEPRSVLVLEGTTPHIVKSVSFLEEGVTQVTIFGYTLGCELTEFAVSIRPVLAEGDVELKPMGAVAVDLGSVLIKQRNGLGLPLESGRDYLLEPETGSITLLGGHVVEEGVRYTLRYTAITSVSPTYKADGTVSYPKYSASYSVRIDASKYEGLPLLAKCTIEEKDTFILPIVDEVLYASEISAQLLQESSSTIGDNQPSTPSPRQGVSIGLYDHLARDVIARNKISFYHGLVSVVDDLVSATTGKIVGDQDGRFRFNIEQGSVDYVGSGLEDPVTRLIEPLYAPLEYLESIGISKTEKDNYGSLSVNTLKGIYEGQRLFIENEMDDYVLVGTKTERELSLSYPFLSVSLNPIYKQMWKPQDYSRLYPSSASFFSVLYPSEGGYSYPETAGSVIGQIENPARGELTGLSSVSSITKRPCRMRVLDYQERGFPQVAGSKNRPTFLVSVVPFDQFPYNADGTPDTSRLVYEGNPNNPDVPSVESGNPSLSFLGLSVGDVLELGREGEGFAPLLDVSEQRQSDADLFPTLFLSAPKKVRVREIIEGCYVVLEGKASFLEWRGAVLSARKGDTLLESLSGDIDDTESKGGFYRVGADIGVRNLTGELRDISLPSINDPDFPLQEIYEQNVPSPLMPFEGVAQFANASVTPFLFPALLGEPLNDSGDESIPYLSQLSERELLADVAGAVRGILGAQEGGAYLYPDEIAEDNAQINSDALVLSSSLTPFTGGQIASKDIEQGDLVLIELSDGASGFLEVSTVEGQNILPPRFKSPVPQGNIEYKIDSYFLGTNPVGLRVGQFPFNGGYVTKFLLASNADPCPTYDGLISFLESATAVGKTNSFEFTFLTNVVFNFAYDGASWEFHDGAGNHVPVTITPYGTAQGQPIIDRGFEISSVTPIIDQAVWLNKIIPNGGVLSYQDNPTQTYLLDGPTGIGHDYGVDLNLKETYIFVGGVAGLMAGGSQTAEILSDRLTLTDGFLTDILSSSALLEVGNCDLVVDGGATPSSINSVVEINNGLAFNNLSTPATGGVRVPALRGYGNTQIIKSGLNLTTLIGSRVTEGATIYEGVGVTLNYGLGALEVPLADDLSFVRSQDLVFINSGHSAGTHRVWGVVPEEITTFTYPVVAPQINSVTDNQDGTYTLELSAPVSDYYGVVPVELGVILDKAGVRGATPETSGIFLNVDSVADNVVVVSGISSDLNGDPYVGVLSELLVVGLELIGFDQVPFDPSRTEIGFSFYSFACVALDTQSSYVPHGACSLNVAGTNTDLSNELGFVHLDGSAPSPALVYVLTGDVITFSVEIKKGIYIDPTFPRMCHDYSAPLPNYFGTAQAYGLYSASTFSTEVVDVSVRRLRRFSDIFAKLATAFESLNPLYEIRRGVVGSLVQVGEKVTLTPSLVNRRGELDPNGKSTQVGDFVDMVSKGDKITILNASNEPVMRLKVLVVSATLECAYISGEIPSGDSYFEVEVRNNLVPQEQSFERFVSLAFTETHSSEQGKVDGDGKLNDGDITLNYLSFSESLIGQYLVIDPQGELDTANEYGAPPQGDKGVVGQPAYEAGEPSPYDDNRGVYKIIGVEADKLEVEPVYPIGGVSYFLPTVNGEEGGALRETASAVGGTHNGATNSAFSIEPFSYKILKRNTEVSEELTDTMMFFRERLLSWVEVLASYNEIKPITWDEYVSQGLISEVGSVDKTYLTNAELLGIEGYPDEAGEPFVTDYDCLSVLDRRFLIEDTRLSSDGFSEIGEGMPSLTESGISFMEAREKRFSWINVRAGLLNGTLARIDRVDFDNPNSKALEDINNG